ncbi:hypothetical protein [Pseudomonas frederiksbergensis]|uniref:hypothetical protein n=1 Tax=Pseudomonas frederiksbergensis TaxID=104087 RepID=UPI0015E47B92|nr:hypothetical protein [Pseudomonas frederiksbergensis]
MQKMMDSADSPTGTIVYEKCPPGCGHLFSGQKNDFFLTKDRLNNRSCQPFQTIDGDNSPVRHGHNGGRHASRYWEK